VAVQDMCLAPSAVAAHLSTLTAAGCPAPRAGTPLLTHSSTPMAGRLQDSPTSRIGGYTSPLRGSQQSIGAYKAAGGCLGSKGVHR
jgi:hypothetical protein